MRFMGGAPVEKSLNFGASTRRLLGMMRPERGIVQADFADVLFRASAFARVIAAGRAVSEEGSTDAASRMQHLADDLESAARQELSTGLA